MATFKTISSADIKTTTSNLNQLIDFVDEDVSGSSQSSRKTYQVFVTSSTYSGTTNAITSSLFHTVFDQDYRLQTANELFDITVGLYNESDTVVSSSTATDSANGNKRSFPSQSLMMREKINIYRQYAQLLLGNADSKFTAPFTNAASDGSDDIDEALFINFKRLFVRDGIKRETFALKMFQSSSFGSVNLGDALGPIANNTNISVSATHPGSGSAIYVDLGSANSAERSPTGGDVGNIVNSANTNVNAGILFYQQGIAVLDMKKAFNGNQFITGSIDCVGGQATTPISGAFIPDFVTSASIDQILDHVATTRFGSGSTTTLTFQNNTKINSTLVFCRATADEFNFSSNPTYKDSDGKIVVIDTEGEDKAFSFVSSIGLYDANEELLAVAKLSRPVEKNDEKDITFRVRLDF